MSNMHATDGQEAGDSSSPVRISSSHLAALLEISPDALILINQAGGIVMVNQQAEALFGYPRAQLLDQPLERLLPERFREGHSEHRTRYFSAPRTRSMGTDLPLVGQRKNGTKFPVDIRLEPLLLDERLVVLGAIRDMTQQHCMQEKALTHRRKQDHPAAVLSQLAAIVDSSEDAILGKTLQGVITSWNRSAERLYGYAADDILGKSILLLVPPDHQDELPTILEQIQQGKPLQRYETVRVRKDGTPIEVSVSVSPIRDAEGRIVGASTIAHDITEQKCMVQELARRNHELERINGELLQKHNELAIANLALEEASSVRGQFLSTMSHEIRTPLASIVGFSEMLLEDARTDGSDEQQRINLERILKNGEHLLELVNDVLDLAKIEAGRMVLDSSQVDVRELVSSVITEIESLAIARNLALRAEIEEGMNGLETNAGKLHQILLNLVSNALKFTEQGSVVLSATHALLSDKQTPGIAFAVKDTGIGIPPEVQTHLFEAFYQADSTYTRKVGGTGLGLAIVDQFTALLGGTITLQSTPGEGSTFTVTLPIKAVHRYDQQMPPRLHSVQFRQALTLFPSPEPRVPEQAPAFLAGSGPHNVVLAVDDNPDTMVLIKTALRDMPYTVIGVEDPLTAMAQVQELHPCAITLDVMMPGLNGWQLLHQLKDNPATASIPVVMLTVLAEKAAGYVLGADEYMIKPFQKDVLCNTLERLIRARNG